MENPLFRKKSLERITSPEQLQDYMRVTSPGIWMVLGAVIALLVGAIVSSALGRLETTLPVQATVDERAVTIELDRDQAARVESGMPLRLGDREVEIGYVYDSENGPAIATAEVDLPDGRYDARIVTESIAPISFLIND